MARHRRDDEEIGGAPPQQSPTEGSGSPKQTKDQTPQQRTTRRRTIRGRLARILALPLIAVVVLLAIVVTNDTNAYRTATATATAVELTLAVQDLVQDLQQERGLTNNVLGGDVSFKPALPLTRSLVISELVKVENLAAVGGDNAVATSAALRRLDDLTAIRSRVDAGQIPRSEAFAYFTERIAALTGIDFGLDRSPDLTLRRGVSALEALGEAKEMTAQERAFLGGVFAAGGFAPDEYRQFSTINAQQTTAIERYYRFADPRQREILFRSLDTGAAREAAFFEQRALLAVNQPFLVSPQSWWSAHTTVIDDMRAAQQSVGDDIAARAGLLRNQASLRLGGLIALAVLSAGGAIAIVVTAARSITRPLAALAAEARAVATQRLPDAVTRVQSAPQGQAPPPPTRVAVPRRSSAEIVDVAEALNSAQATAYSLATEQAILRRSTSESLANLGRRNQNLLRRQLGFITQLEREEIDPAGLANLFELDHLATRMRRNAESLLVLVGESSPRTWSEPLPVSDVLRAAISEVEDYRRVTLRRIDDAYVGGAFVAGIAHMIAELVENGLAFSPPDTDVEIQGRLLPGRYLIGITDSGIGMDDQDMARANARLRGQESYLSAPTRYLGHYVVGHLAQQMGVDVQIGRSPVTGVTARVTLPANVLATPRALGTNGFSAPTSATGPQRMSRPGEAARAIAPPANATSAANAMSGNAMSAGNAMPAANGMPAAGPGSGPMVEYVVAEPAAKPMPTTPAPQPQPAQPAWPQHQPAYPPQNQPAAWPPPPGPPPPGNPVGAPIPVEARVGSMENFTAEFPGGFPGADDDTGEIEVIRGDDVRADSTRGDMASQVAHGSGERTRNGLMKRVPRQRLQQPVAGRPAAAPAPGHATWPASESERTQSATVSATEVRSRLTSLRAGVQRAGEDNAARDGSAARDDSAAREDSAARGDRAAREDSAARDDSTEGTGRVR